MASEVSRVIFLELFDSRKNPPVLSSFTMPSLNGSPLTIYDALVYVNIVSAKDDALFEKKGAIGVFSIPLGPNDPIYDGDRIELYRPILIDPKKIRRKKANQDKDAELKTKAKVRKERKEMKDL
jgi:hypothetical protein